MNQPRQFCDGYSISILPDGLVKIEGEAPMTADAAEAFFARRHQSSGEAPSTPIVDYAAEDLKAAVVQGLLLPSFDVDEHLRDYRSKSESHA